MTVSRGRHLNLDEARKLGKIDRFAKTNPATETGRNGLISRVRLL